MPVHMNNRRIGGQVAPLIEQTHPPPAGAVTHPIDRMFSACIATPGKPVFGPVRIGRIAAIFDKFCKLATGHRRPRHMKRRNLDVMRPFFVIENECIFGPGSEPESPAGNMRIAVKRPRHGKPLCSYGTIGPEDRASDRRASVAPR